ncbi:hypothetical protein V8E53_010962 [Lactarius tabidus]
MIRTRLSAKVSTSRYLPVDVTHSAPDEYPTPAPDDTGTNSADMDANSADPDSVDSDPVDTTDADVWEALTQGMDAAFDPDQRHTSDVPSSIPPSSEVPRSSTPPPDPPIQVDDSNTTNSQTELTIDSFLHGCPGAQIALNTSTWAPFHSKCNWDIVLWAKLRGPSSTAFTELLQIPEVNSKLGLSYSTAKDLDRIIDTLPGRPAFQSQDLTIGEETLTFYFQDIMQCIQALYGDPEFVRDLVFAPEHCYMHTGDWWWAVQTSLESQKPGTSVIPIILSSDKTQLTLFRSKAAYPVYLTIGNIPKSICRKPSRHARMLVGYIPTTKLEGMTNQAARCLALANLFHSCMRHLMALITPYSEGGVPMMSSDGVWRRCHPIYAVFIGDYPEQALVTCTYNGRCPKCVVLLDQMGEFMRFPLRSYDEAFDTYLLADGDIRPFNAACRKVGLKPVFHPFWELFPLSNIFVSITPDILHQLLQGVMKHLITWLTCAFGTVAIDTRCRSLPPNHHIATFAKGITGLSRVTGQEHKNICRILLGLIVDTPLSQNGAPPLMLVRSIRALLDFLYIAQLPSQTPRFHDNKSIFVDLDIQEHFNFPKLHSLILYSPSIRLFGTTDNYNTEQTEHLHIELAKLAFEATNHKNEYPQMTTWVERHDKVQKHFAFLKQEQGIDQASTRIPQPTGPPQPSPYCIKMALHPTRKVVSFDDLAESYGAVDFQDALADYIARINHPDLSATALRAQAANTLIPFHSVPVYHKIKFQQKGHPEVMDSILVWPEQTDSHGCRIPLCFDTALVHSGSQDSMHGINGHRVVQVRVVFQLPKKAIPEVFPGLDEDATPTHLAYVEWFSPIPSVPDANHQMHRVSQLVHNGRRCASIIPVNSIASSIHLFPRITTNLVLLYCSLAGEVFPDGVERNWVDEHLMC